MRRRIRVVQLAEVFELIRRQEGAPEEFPPEVLAAADHLALDDRQRQDLRALPFVTIDPPGSMDLDQAMCLEDLDDGGIRLRYAIADLEPFVAPGGPIDREARRRGVTIYCPDIRVPLHPPALSEGAGSLLPEADRPAVVWEIDIDADGEPLRCDVRQAMVRSKARFDYSAVQAAFDRDQPPEPLAPLRRFGELRIRRGVERGALALRLPEQEAEQVDDRWTLAIRPEKPAERWNAEVSLLTGMMAARMMTDQGVGILRTLPAPTSEAVGQLRGAAKGLGIAWSRDIPAPVMLSELDPARPRQLALFQEATSLFGGAAYLGFRHGVPQGDIGHGGVAAAYAHVTAPLRRLVDRFASAICIAIAEGRAVPGWAEEAIEEIPEVMEETTRLANGVEGRCINAVEAWVMSGRIGDTFEAVVVADWRSHVELWIDDPPVLTRSRDVRAKAGQVIEVVVDDTDVIRGMIRLSRTD